MYKYKWMNTDTNTDFFFFCKDIQQKSNSTFRERA